MATNLHFPDSRHKKASGKLNGQSDWMATASRASNIWFWVEPRAIFWSYSLAACSTAFNLPCLKRGLLAAGCFFTKEKRPFEKGGKGRKGSEYLFDWTNDSDHIRDQNGHKNPDGEPDTLLDIAWSNWILREGMPKGGNYWPDLSYWQKSVLRATRILDMSLRVMVEMAATLLGDPGMFSPVVGLTSSCSCSSRDMTQEFKIQFQLSRVLYERILGLSFA